MLSEESNNGEQLQHPSNQDDLITQILETDFVDALQFKKIIQGIKERISACAIESKEGLVMRSHDKPHDVASTDAKQPEADSC